MVEAAKQYRSILTTFSVQPVLYFKLFWSILLGWFYCLIIIVLMYIAWLVLSPYYCFKLLWLYLQYCLLGWFYFTLFIFFQHNITVLAFSIIVNSTVNRKFYFLSSNFQPKSLVQSLPKVNLEWQKAWGIMRNLLFKTSSLGSSVKQ